MIPTPQRIRANRRWSALLAFVIAGSVTGVGFSVAMGPIVSGAMLALGCAAGAALYRFGTRLMRRRKTIVRRGLADELADILAARVPYYQRLDTETKDRFRLLAAVFLDETTITGVGCEIDDTVRVLVAASAMIPILGFPDWEYSTLREVLVQPGDFVARTRESDEDVDPLLGMVDRRGGTFHGTLILSREELIRGFSKSNDKSNVGIHEFAHLVDEGDGGIDGIPAYLPRELIRQWMDLVSRQLDLREQTRKTRQRDEHRRRYGHDGDDWDTGDDWDADDDQRSARRQEGEPAADQPSHPDQPREDWSDMPAYAFTNEQEFFAVATEYFFEAPRQLAARHPKLHEMLRQTFRQNPAGAE